MRIKYLLTITLFFITVICAKQAIGQTPTADQIRVLKIDQLSDDQITLIWQRLQGTGLNESEIYKELLKRGMQAGQVQALKDRVTLLGLNSKNSGVDDDRRSSNARSNSRIDYSRRQRDTVITPNSRRNNSRNNNTLPASRNNQSSSQRLSDRNAPTNRRTQDDDRETTTTDNRARRSTTSPSSRSREQTRNMQVDDEDDKMISDDDRRDDQIKDVDELDDVLRRFRLIPKKLEIYGLDFFKQQEITFEPNFSVATPPNYVLGPGDEVIVLLTGLNETSVTNTVSPEGNLQIPHAEIIHVSGFTIDQAKSLVNSKLSKIYPALKSGQTKLALNLGNPRSVRVNVIGEASVPGTYTLSSLANAFNVLYHAGGPNENGTLRSIQLIRNNKVYKTLDFYNFLQNGLSENIRLEDQDVLNIPVYKKRIGIKGEIKRPALYELKDNETLADLIKYAGGFSPKAYQGMAKVDQINDLQHQLKDVPASVFANYLPQTGDMVEIQEVSERYTNRITLEGSVYQPGMYELTAGLTLGELLKKAQGLKPEAYAERGIINRTLPNLEKSAIPFKPLEVLNGKNDVPLMREDSVVIFDRSAFITEQVVIVEGFVRKPITITYRKGLTLSDAIAQAGGFDVEAAPHRVEISRIIKNQSDVVATQLVNTFVVDMSDSTKANGERELQAMDVVSVRRLVNYKPLGDIAVDGEVIFPGKYSAEKRDETALDFLTRAGGLTPFGSLENVQVFREGTRVNVDLTNKNLNVTNKMILLPGDSVFVPRVVPYVEVAGAVNSPQYISYKGKRFGYYIDAAAGVTEEARLKGAYISYPNGLNKSVKHILFFRSYPPVTPGSIIYVPEKNPNAKKLSIAELGGLATALTAIVSLIAILSR
jgi:protein involved in polysaccharide export with SLBB domain